MYTFKSFYRQLILVPAFTACLHVASFAASCVEPVSDSLASREHLPCYKQLEQQIFYAAYQTISSTTSITGGIVDFVATADKLNREFRRCMATTYPLSDKN